MVRRIGFTLIELMAVVALLGVTAATVAWSMTGTVQRRTQEDVIARVAQIDGQARQIAERAAAPLTVRYDLDGQRVRWIGGPGMDGSHPRGVPAPFRIDRLVIMGDQRGPIRSGRIDIAVSSRGRSATYAVCMTDDNDRHAWLVFAGLTGQMTWIDDDTEIDSLFNAFRLRRPDAD